MLSKTEKEEKRKREKERQILKLEMAALTFFNNWLKGARSGEHVTYFRGFLMHLREREDAKLEQLALSNAAWRLAHEKKVILLQKKNGDYDYSYLAIKA